tara:strand:+ start:521 stop:1636 length:1116 start_codon:yes stop_codon:yes gene_type:complete
MIDEKTLNSEVKRIWILGDMHLGVRSNSMEWLDIQKDFYENQFIPHLKANVRKGDILVQVGDAFDNRQSINLKVLHYAIDLFERLGEILPTHVIAGNHDIWAKKSNEVTSIDTLKWIPNVSIYKDPRMFKWGGKNVLLMPWRTGPEHEAETLAEFPNTNIVFCHSEVMGVALNSKVKNIHGTDISAYRNFEVVYSGHIHYRQTKGVLKLVGTPYELTRSDIDNIKGFDMVDLSTMEETFVENKVSPKFVKLFLSKIYDMTLGEFKDIIKDNFVDLYVPSHIATTTALSKLINKVQGIGRRIEPTIYEQESMVDVDMSDINDEDLYKDYDVTNLIKVYLDSSNYDEETKNRIESKLTKLHSICAYNFNPDTE